MKKKRGARTVTRRQLLNMFKKCCKNVSNCTIEEAMEKLKNGEYEGTAMEDEMRGFLWLLGEE